MTGVLPRCLVRRCHVTVVVIVVAVLVVDIAIVTKVLCQSAWHARSLTEILTILYEELRLLPAISPSVGLAKERLRSLHS